MARPLYVFVKVHPDMERLLLISFCKQFILNFVIQADIKSTDRSLPPAWEREKMVSDMEMSGCFRKISKVQRE